MTYTIKLISLECFKAEEIDGDEVYLKLNGAKVWEASPDKMTPLAVAHDSVRHYDFAGGRKQTGEGWIPLMPYNPDLFVFKEQLGPAVLQVWDADTLTSDDLLGQTPIDETQGGGGNISVVFQRLGAHYRLTYKVEV